MTVWEAILLGTIQGVFMFVPVRSTSHLALTQHWLISRGSTLPAPDSAEMIFFDLIVHVGTLVSMAVVFRKSLRQFIGHLAAGVRSGFITTESGYALPPDHRVAEDRLEGGHRHRRGTGALPHARPLP